jgi:phage terminase large subunit
VFSPERLAAEKQSYIDDFGLEYGTAKFEQEYLCSFDSANLGAILASSIGRLEGTGRIGNHVEFDPLGADIFISADLGRRDTATWWFWQPKIGGYSLIDYDGGWGIDAEEWVDRLALRLAKYPAHKLGKIWLPHDARAKTFAAKHSALEIFIKKFGAAKVDIVPGSSISDRVNAARTVIDRCEFHETNCEQGLSGLRAWSYKYDDKAKIFSSEPIHDWASHDGDGFSYGCLIMQQHKPKIETPVKQRFDTDMTFNEMMQRAARARQND